MRKAMDTKRNSNIEFESKEKLFTKREWILRYSSPFKSMMFMAGPMIIITMVNATYGIIDKQLTLNYAIGDVKALMAENPKFYIDGVLANKTIVNGNSSEELIRLFAKQLINVSTQYSNTIIFMLSALTLFTCVGTSIKWGQAMGRRNKKEMDSILINGFIQNLLLTFIGLLLLHFFAPLILTSQTNISYASREHTIQFILANDYTEKFIYGLPLFATATFLSTMLRTEGKVWWIIVINIVSIVLNICFGIAIMQLLPVGSKMAGAVYGSMVAWSFVIVSSLCVIKFSKNTLLKPSFKGITIKFKDALSIWSLGLSSFVSNFIFAFSNFLLTLLVTTMHTNQASINEVVMIRAHIAGSTTPSIAYLTPALRVLSAGAPWTQVLWAPMIGMMQGCNVNHAYNRGANKRYRMVEIFKLQFALCIIWGVMVEIFLLSIGGKMLAAFDGPSNKGMWLFYYMSCFPLIGITLSSLSIFQGAGNPKLATTLSIFRSLVSTLGFAIIGWAIAKSIPNYDGEQDKWLFIMYGFAEIPAAITSLILANILCKSVLKRNLMYNEKDSFSPPSYLKMLCSEAEISKITDINRLNRELEHIIKKLESNNFGPDKIENIKKKYELKINNREKKAENKEAIIKNKYKLYDTPVSIDQLENKISYYDRVYLNKIDRVQYSDKTNKQQIIDKLVFKKESKIEAARRKQEKMNNKIIKFRSSGKKITPLKVIFLGSEPQPREIINIDQD
ncbi:MATE family efflux transporter [Spiroplasma endosymbiont of Aspidapion aeneum]|uniref:MATE family efflux transporter n=1 Tax=Spiroplasma endosymbiont of Aspidapion aeneum TaxID=3066276 RepID=UPI00313F3DB2